MDPCGIGPGPRSVQNPLEIISFNQKHRTSLSHIMNIYGYELGPVPGRGSEENSQIASRAGSFLYFTA